MYLPYLSHASQSACFHEYFFVCRFLPPTSPAFPHTYSPELIILMRRGRNYLTHSSFPRRYYYSVRGIRYYYYYSWGKIGAVIIVMNVMSHDWQAGKAGRTERHKNNTQETWANLSQDFALQIWLSGNLASSLPRVSERGFAFGGGGVGFIYFVAKYDPPLGDRPKKEGKRAIHQMDPREGGEGRD